MKLRRLKAIAVKEVLQVWRDPRSLMIALLLPFTQMFLFGYGVNLDLKHLPVCTFDREGSQLSQALFKHFQASQYFTIARNVKSYAEVVAAIDNADCGFAIVVPPGLLRTPKRHRNRLGPGHHRRHRRQHRQYRLRLCGGGGRRLFERRLQVSWMDRQGKPLQQIQPMVVQSRVWFNEDLESRNFIIPGLVAMIMALVGAQLTSLTISREWERGTMELLISTPVKPNELMFGKLVPYLRARLARCRVLPGACGAVVRRALSRHAVCALRHDVAFSHRRSQHRLSDVGVDPQPGRRQSDRATGHDAADHAALGLHIPDRPDAEGGAGHHLSDLFAILRFDRQRLCS